MSEAILPRARAGDEHAFRELTDPYRRELHLHCYRMLGSVADAEDMLQETLFAAWRGLPDFEGRASVRGWLYRIATNRCLNAVRDGKRRPPPEPVPPFLPPPPSRRGDVTWLQPYPDALLDLADSTPGPEARYEVRETVELAFVAALQRLPPRQTATLLLRDVLGFPAGEVAAMLGTTETAVKGILQRAHASLAQHRPADRRPPAPPAGSSRERALTRRFAEAFTAGDIDGVVALLTDDAWLAMPPAPHEYHGCAAIAAFLQASTDWRRGQALDLVLTATRANTQPAFGCTLTGPGEPAGRPAGMIVLTLAGDHIRGITRFLDELPPQSRPQRVASMG